MKYEFKFAERSFKNDQGEVIKYVAPVVVIDGKEFELHCKKSDKALFRYLMSKLK